MVYHYTKKGVRPSVVFNVSEGERAWLYACMIEELQEREKTGGICPFLAK
jgi:hypothetical protein